jgi:hypothetical protein
MTGRTLAIGLAVLGLGVLGYAFFARQTDEEQILDLLHRLEDAVRVEEGGGNPLMRMSKVNGAFEEIFDENVSFRIPEHTTASRGRRTLAGLVTKIGPYFTSLDITFEDITIDFESEQTRAQVACYGAGDGFSRGGRWNDKRRVRFVMDKRDGDWLISDLRVFPKGEEPADDDSSEGSAEGEP